MKDNMKPEWWKEIDPHFDFEQLPELKETKQLLKTQDTLEIPEDEDFFDQMHDQIMSGIENRTIQMDRGSIWQRHRRLMKRTVAAILALTVIILGRQTHDHQHQDQTTVVLSDALQRSDVEDSILVYQHKNEFFVDLASENLDHLSVSQLKELMQTEMLN